MSKNLSLVVLGVDRDEQEQVFFIQSEYQRHLSEKDAVAGCKHRRLKFLHCLEIADARLDAIINAADDEVLTRLSEIASIGAKVRAEWPDPRHQ
ncbi:MAG: hypothetical protein PHV42_02915 [Candidatus Pacebacteria bacterium]|nr:hypothetical protein [Candidatus Paceibacterota bacterium]